MPKIATYDSQVSPETNLPGGPGHGYASSDSFGGGRGVDTAGAGLMDAADTMYAAEQREEVSNVAAQMATLRGELTAQFTTSAAENAGKPGFTDKFMADATNKIQSLGGTYQTKAGMMAYSREAAELTSTFLEKTTSYNVAVAGAKAVTDFHTMVNQNAGTLFNDPSQAPSVFKSVENAFSDPAGAYAGVPATERDQLKATAKEQLAIAAGRGVAMSNPDLAEKLYKKGNLPGQDFLTEQGNAQIVSYISTMQNAERTKKALAIAQAERADRINSENAQVSILRHLETNPNDPNNVAMILKSPMKAPAMMTMLELAKHVGGPDSNHDTNTYGPGFIAAYDAVHKGQIASPDQLYSEVSKGNLTVAGVNLLTGEIQGKRTPQGQIESQLKDNFVKAMKQQLSGTNDLLHLRDPKGEQIAQQALAWFLPAYEAAKADGKVPPTALLDPSNQHSLWSGAMRFKRDPNTMMRDIKAANAAPGLGIAPKVVKFDDLP